jgi:cytochrome c-type biogenesis protein CcmF
MATPPRSATAVVRGLVHGIAVKPRGLDDIYVAATTEVAQWGNMSVHRLLVTAARANLDRCNAVGAWLLLSAYAGRPLTAEEVEELMALNPRGYVVLVKMIPFVNLVWIGAALATAGGILSTVRQARSPRRRSA